MLNYLWITGAYALKSKSDYSGYLQVSTGPLDRWDVVWKSVQGIEENIFSVREREKVGSLYMSLYCSEPITRLSPSPPSPRIPVVSRAPESQHALSIHTGGDSIMPWWKAMENQLGIQGRGSTMHGHTGRRRQAICCDEEALYWALLRPPGSPSSPTEPSTHFFPNTSAHIKLQSRPRWIERYFACCAISVQRLLGDVKGQCACPLSE